MVRVIYLGSLALAVLVAGGINPAGAGPLEFTVTHDTTSGPPYPSTPPIAVTISDDHSVPFENLALSVNNVIPSDPCRIDAGIPVGSHRTAVIFHVFGPAPPPIAPPSPLRIDQLFEFKNLAGDFDTLVGHPNVTFTDSTFLVTFRIVPPQPIVPSGPQDYQVRGSLTQIGVRFKNVTITDPPPSHFDLVVDLEGSIDPTSSVYTMTLTGQVVAVPEPSTLGLLGIGMAGLGLYTGRSAKRRPARV